MTLDEKLRSASDDARARVQHLDVPPLRTGGWQRVMTQLRTTMTKRRGAMRNRPVLVFAGAVLAVVLVVGVVAVLQARSEDPVTEPPPAVSTTTAPVSAPLDLDRQPQGDLAAGTYAVTSMEPFEINITVPSGWRLLSVPATVWAREDSAVNLGFAAVDNVFADPCHERGGPVLDPPVGPTVDDLIDALPHAPDSKRPHP